MSEYKIPIKENSIDSDFKSRARLSKINKEVRLMVFKIIMALVPTTFVAALSLPAAYRYRGYPAVGGEWLLIIGTFAFSFNVISTYIKEIIRKERRERKYYQSK